MASAARSIHVGACVVLTATPKAETSSYGGYFNRCCLLLLPLPPQVVDAAVIPAAAKAALREELAALGKRVVEYQKQVREEVL